MGNYFSSGDGIAAEAAVAVAADDDDDEMLGTDGAAVAGDDGSDEDDDESSDDDYDGILYTFVSSNCLGEYPDQYKNDARVVAIQQECGRTDNILLTELGKERISTFLYLLMQQSCRAISGCVPAPLVGRWWELEDDAFDYLLEVWQANVIYFLKRRYFDLRVGRAGYPIQWENWGRDLKQVFPFDGTTRDFSALIDEFDVNYADSIARDGRDYEPLWPRSKRAFERLHYRSGIYLPVEKVLNEHWVTMWWTLSSLFVWILDPSIAVGITEHGGDGCIGDGIIKIPLSVMQPQAKMAGLPIDRVYLHGGSLLLADQEDEDEEEEFSDMSDDVGSTSEIDEDEEMDDDPSFWMDETE